MWIARDENGRLFIHTQKPLRGSCMFVTKAGDKNYGEISKDLYPEVTWENSPKELVVKEDNA